VDIPFLDWQRLQQVETLTLRNALHYVDQNNIRQLFTGNPKGAIWGNMNWAHASSSDMIYWRHEPIAISPTRGGFDSDGVFSGSAVMDGEVPTVIYTGVMPPLTPTDATLRDGAHTWREVQCLATSHDPELRTWDKSAEPVIAWPPPGLEVTGFRDPFVWREGQAWFLALGSGIKNKGGMVLLYKSTDLRQWAYLNPLIEGTSNKKDTVNPVDKGEMWECPDFFPLGGKHVLLISTEGKVRWKVGTYADQRFTAEKEGIVDWGAYYAAKTMLDADGNRILWGWIPEKRSDAELRAAGWAGCMSLPRALSLGSENHLEMRVAPALSSLRDKKLASLAAHAAPAERTCALHSIKIENLAGELSWQTAKASFSFTLADETGPWWSLKVDHSASASTLQVNEKSIQLPPLTTREMSFHLLLDASVAEFFCNDLHVHTSRIYRKPNGPLRAQMSDSELPILLSFEAWQLHPISPDRLTT